MAKSVKFSEMGIVEPEARLKHLASFGNYIEVDANIPAVRFVYNSVDESRFENLLFSCFPKVLSVGHGNGAHGQSVPV